MQTLKDAFSEAVELYGPDKAKKLEQLYRWETNHFKSKQFKIGYTPGMEIARGKLSFPYGWSSLSEYAKKNNLQGDDFKIFEMKEGGTGILKTFIGFPNVYEAVLFVAYLLDKRGWNLGAWYSTVPAKQKQYVDKVSKVIPRIVNEII